MSLIPVQKVRIVGIHSHYKLLMQELHRRGILHISLHEKESLTVPKKVDPFPIFDLARLEFSINFLEKFSPPKAWYERWKTKISISETEARQRLQEFDTSQAVISECQELSEKLSLVNNTLERLPNYYSLAHCLKDVKSPIQSAIKTNETITVLRCLPIREREELWRELSRQFCLIDLKILGQDERSQWFRLTFHQSIEKNCQELLELFHTKPFSMEGIDLKDISSGTQLLSALKTLEKNAQKQKHQLEKKAQELSIELTNLKVLYDYNIWRQKKNELHRQIFHSQSVFSLEAWVEKSLFTPLKNWVEKSFSKEVTIQAILPDQNETPPTLLRNNRWSTPFRSLTEMYGLPGKGEIDPTGILSLFFFVFFGLCLSDVGYGIILGALYLTLIKAGQWDPSTKGALHLLGLCGASAILGGIALGGYFALTPAQLPWLVNPETGMFYGQLLAPMDGTGPMTFLGVALALGALHLSLGLLIQTYQHWKSGSWKTALADPFCWLVSLWVLLLWGIAKTQDWNSAALLGWLAIASLVILVMTQGRNASRWYWRPVFGLLGLYNISGYLSDLLSYSRLMALGLATGVIGFAMNLASGVFGSMAPHPWLGVIIATLVIIIGHSLNLVLSTLGAFIHSGRLQFIEFFGKFYEGSGKAFVPFRRETKYLHLTS